MRRVCWKSAVGFAAVCLISASSFAGVNEGGNRQGGINHDRGQGGAEISRDFNQGRSQSSESTEPDNREVCSVD